MLLAAIEFKSQVGSFGSNYNTSNGRGHRQRAGHLDCLLRWRVQVLRPPRDLLCGRSQNDFLYFCRPQTDSDLLAHPDISCASARPKVEALFAELKKYIGLLRLRLRQMRFARELFYLAATAQNFKRLVRLLARRSEVQTATV